MRVLFLIPLIHSPADLGSVGAPLEQTSAALSGEARWTAHQDTVAKFWRSVADLLTSLDPERVKVYQDGLAAEGELGGRIVAQAAKRGSPNHRVVLGLVERGAELRKTEDAALLVQERENILQLTQGASPGGAEPDTQRYRRTRDRLTEARDRFIARTINQTLKVGELGVLFLGAYHEVLPHLAPDISVRALKDPERVRAYFQELLLGRDERRFQELAGYLASPVTLAEP